jgi:hypothetical protein
MNALTDIRNVSDQDAALRFTTGTLRFATRDAGDTAAGGWTIEARP